MSEPIKIVIVSEATGAGNSIGGGSGGSGGALSGVLNQSTIGGVFGSLLRTLSIPALAAAPMLYFTKKIADNSEMFKGIKKTLDIVFGALGDIGIFLMYSTKTMFDSVTAVKDFIAEEIKIFTNLPDNIATAIYHALFPESYNKSEKDQDTGAGKGGSGLKDWLLEQWWSFRKVFGLGKGPQIDAASLFTYTTTFDLSKSVKMPKYDVKDMFSKTPFNFSSLLTMKKFKVKDVFDSTPYNLLSGIKMPKLGVSDIFDTKDFDLKPRIKLPKIPLSDLFDLSEEAGKDLIKKIEKITGFDIPGV